MSDAAGSESWSYDTMGRNWADQRTSNGVTHTFVYSYNLDGSLKSAAYPSGRTVSYAYNAAARPLSVADASINYAQSAVYYAPGELNTLTVGLNGSYSIGLTQTFNDRLQPNNFTVTTPGGAVMNLTYGFNLGSTDNGNVMSITNNRDTTRNQTFTYDSLNRIASGSTAATTGANCWGMTFNIDQWSNLYSNTALSGYSSCSQNMLNLSVSASSNRITTSGFSYDSAGDTLGDGLYSYAYDAEARQKTAAGVTYTYDGDGLRVEKLNGTLYWYGSGGEVLSETDLSGNNPVDYVYFGGTRLARVVSGTPYYYFEDHLESARINVQAGQNTACYEADFEPYGREHVITSTCSQHYKFAGMERDSETGNDHAKFRQSEPNLGRWLSADPAGTKAVTLTDPQTWNLYAYVRNNPTTLNDPSGLLCPNECPGPLAIPISYKHPYNLELGEFAGEDNQSKGSDNSATPQEKAAAQNTDVAQNETTDKLVNAQNAAMNSPAYQPGAVTHCNQATCDVAKATGAPMGPLTDAHGNPLKADQIRANLAKPDSGYKPVSAAEAEQLANQGKLVIVAGPGHVSTVRPDNIPGQNVPGKGPVIANVGRDNGVLRLNYVFTKSALPEVKFYTPNQ
jgi:RHS repeat-associated protein